MPPFPKPAFLDMYLNMNLKHIARLTPFGHASPAEPTSSTLKGNTNKVRIVTALLFLHEKDA